MFIKRIVWPLVAIFLLVETSQTNLLHDYERYVERTNRDVDRRLGETDVQNDTWWTHERVLADNFVMKWFVHDEEIIFRLEVKTLANVAVGFSWPVGEMIDVVVVDRGATDGLQLQDGHRRGDGAIDRDRQQDYNLLRGEANATHTLLEFSRLLDTCDPDDIPFTSDSMRVHWYIFTSESDDVFDAIAQWSSAHWAVNTRGVLLLSPHPGRVREPLNRKWELTLSNFVVNDNMDTLYWCKIFKPPTLQEKHHIVGYEPVIGANHTGIIARIVLYECELTHTPNLNEWESYVRASGAACYGPFMPKAWEVCVTPVIVWSRGGDDEFLPEHVGIPLHERANTYYMMEAHFDNGARRRSVSTTGLTVHYTRHLRRYDAGIMRTGVSLTAAQVIPPKQTNYKSAGVCSADCTNTAFPKHGVNVVSVLMHTHLTGAEFRVRHVRNGDELPPIVADAHYDPMYQQARRLAKEKVIFPGDVLITECGYRTVTRQRATIGGYSARQETCQTFLTYYPKSQLSSCTSMPPVKYFFDVFGVRQFYGRSMRQVEDMFTGSEPTVYESRNHAESSREVNLRAIQALQTVKGYTLEGDTSATDGALGQLVIKEPTEFRNKTFISHLNELPWHEMILTKRIEESFYRGQHLTFCRKRDRSLILPAMVQKFPLFNEFPSDNVRACKPNVDVTSDANNVELSRMNGMGLYLFIMSLHAIFGRFA